MISVSIQPFAPVVESVYVPGFVIEIVLVLAKLLVPFDHAKVVPPEPVKLILVVLQVSTLVLVLLVITATGAVISCVITKLVVVVQPFWSRIPTV